MHDSTLAHLIATNGLLRTRLDVLFQQAVSAAAPTMTATDRLILRTTPADALSQAVANNPTIFTTIKASVDVDGDVSKGIDSVPDSDLQYVIVSEIAALV